MIKTTVKCTLCDVQMSPWCQGRCIHAKPIVPTPKAEKKPNNTLVHKNPPQGGRIPIPVYCVTTKTWYESANEASLAVNCAETNINRACSDKNQKAAGMRWMKADNPDLPEEAKPKIRYKKKLERRVKNIRTGAEYDNIAAAAKALKLNVKSAYTYIGKNYKGNRIIEYIMPEAAQ